MKTKEEEIKLEVMNQIKLLFPLSKEPIAIMSGIELGIQAGIQSERERIEKFKNRINQFGFRADIRANIVIRRQVLEILEEELKKETS